MKMYRRPSIARAGGRKIEKSARKGWMLTSSVPSAWSAAASPRVGAARRRRRTAREDAGPGLVRQCRIACSATSTSEAVVDAASPLETLLSSRVIPCDSEGGAEAALGTSVPGMTNGKVVCLMLTHFADFDSWELARGIMRRSLLLLASLSSPSPVQYAVARVSLGCT